MGGVALLDESFVVHPLGLSVNFQRWMVVVVGEVEGKVFIVRGHMGCIHTWDIWMIFRDGKLSLYPKLTSLLWISKT
jgi:hypothetical protein